MRRRTDAVVLCRTLLALTLALLGLCATLASGAARAGEAPHIVAKDGRFALMVDGRPFLVLGGQLHNSSGWPGRLPQAWDSLAALHANTVEAPVYWEQMEPAEGRFDFGNVDRIVEGARAHGLHVILLWFGTWKNGNMHYVPAWVKADGRRFPRVVRADGEPIDVLSALSPDTLKADRAAFAALMRHLREIDGERHSVIMVQVENESGIVGSDRDHDPQAERLFNAPVPADMLAAAGKRKATAGSWREVFGGEADELFQVYHQARFMNAVAAAGKAEFDVPLYANVWLNYPVAELPQRQLDHPGVAYPSGGPWQRRVDVWKALAPAIDVIAPDIYSDDSGFVRKILATYARPDNPLWIPETGNGESYGKLFFYALGQGTLGVSPFGIDKAIYNGSAEPDAKAHARNFALAGPMSRELAQWSFEGRIKTAAEERGAAEQELDFGDWGITVAFGYPLRDGRPAPGTADAHGGAIAVRLGPDEFLVTGVDASFSFHLPGRAAWSRSEIVTAQEGSYENGRWTPARLLNGDETDRGIHTYQMPTAVRVKLGRF
jgi:hypothetical protein